MNPFGLWFSVANTSRALSRIAPLVLVGTGSINVWRSTDDVPRELVAVNRLNAATCFTAATFYVALNFVPVENRFMLRCCDWLLTCPMLIIEICKLLGIRCSSIISTLVTLTILMIASGFAALTNESFASLGFVCLSAIYAIIASAERDPAYQILPVDTVWSFLASWMLFGAVFYIRDPFVRDASYSVLDIFSKGVFGLTIGAAGTETTNKSGRMV